MPFVLCCSASYYILLFNLFVCFTVLLFNVVFCLLFFVLLYCFIVCVILFFFIFFVATQRDSYTTERKRNNPLGVSAACGWQRYPEPPKSTSTTTSGTTGILRASQHNAKPKQKTINKQYNKSNKIT